MVPSREIGRSKASGWDEGNSAGELTKKVVPVFGGRTQAANRRIPIAHALGHGVAGGIGVKSAKDGETLSDERWKPRWVRPGAGGGKAAAV